MLTLHYTGQLLSGELEKGKEREKEIRKRWKGRGKEEERWDRIVVVGGGRGVHRVSGECGNLQQQQNPNTPPIPPLYTPHHPFPSHHHSARSCRKLQFLLMMSSWEI